MQLGQAVQRKRAVESTLEVDDAQRCGAEMAAPEHGISGVGRHGVQAQQRAVAPSPLAQRGRRLRFAQPDQRVELRRRRGRIAQYDEGDAGNVRVGLEDSLWAGPGRLAQSNAEQVRLARQIIEGLGLSVASADEAREMLSLKGGDTLEV